VLNPSSEQEAAWQAQRLEALAAHRRALTEVLALRDVNDRRRYLADYRRRWGALSAEGLEARLLAAWERRFST
jgi:predicted metal-dependent hydrolase